MSKAKPDANDLRRSIGYTMITFMGAFLFLPVVCDIGCSSADDENYFAI